MQRCVIKGNEANFSQLESLAPEFGRVVLVNSRRFSIAVEDVNDRPGLVTAVENQGGRVRDDVPFDLDYQPLRT